MHKRILTFMIIFIMSVSSCFSQELKTELQIGPGKVIELDASFLNKYSVYTLRMDTPWFPKNSLFEGYHFKDILKSLKVSEDKTISVIAYNDYAVDIPAKDVYDYDMILANRHNGAKMSLRNKGPFILLYPFNIHKELATAAFYTKCPWQIKKIVIK